MSRNERTWDQQALASLVLVASARVSFVCVSLVHVSVPPLPWRLAGAWGSMWSCTGYYTVVRVFWLGETTLPGFQRANLVPRTDFQRVYPGAVVGLASLSALQAGPVLSLPHPSCLSCSLSSASSPGERKERQEEEEKRHRRSKRRSRLPSRGRGRGDGGVGDERQRGGDGRGGGR